MHPASTILYSGADSLISFVSKYSTSCYLFCGLKKSVILAIHLLIEEVVVSESDSLTLKLNDVPSIDGLNVGDYFHGLYVHSFLGEGAMGKTFLASHPVLKTPLVIKTFKANKDEDIFKEAYIAHAIAALNGAICLQRAILHTLFGADQRNVRTIVFPALGTGIGEVPMDLGAKLMLEAVRVVAP